MEDLSYLSSPDARRYMVESYNRESMTLSQQLPERSDPVDCRVSFLFTNKQEIF